jgi:hypothetical protein
MAQVPPPEVTPTPEKPIRGTINFKKLVDGFLTWMAIAPAQLQALVANCYANCLDAFASAGAAAAAATAALGFSNTASGFANNAAASATAAAASSTAGAWVSGTAYVIGNVRYSPSDFRTYRRITAGAGATDPSLDAVNWLLISPGVLYIKVSDRKTSGTAGGTSVAADITQARTFNTTEINTIVGASLASNAVTLPAGTYRYRARAPATSTVHQAFLYNATDGTYAGIGFVASADGRPNDSVVSGQFTIAAAKAFTLRHYTTTSTATIGLGIAGSVPGQIEVFAELEFAKVA